MKGILCVFTAMLLAVMIFVSAPAVSVLAAPVPESPESAAAETQSAWGIPVGDAEIFAENQKASADSLLVASRSIIDIREFYRSHPTVYSGAVYAQEPSNKKEFSPGELSSGTLNAALNTLNVMRYAAGIDADVTCNDEINKAMQASALLMAVDDNGAGKLSYNPTKQAGMSNELYNLGMSQIKKANINKSSLKITETLVDTWLGSSSESSRVTMGYRRWLLNPKMGVTGFGYNNGYLAMYALDTSRDTGYSRVAWPAQNTPVEFFNENDPWTVSVGEKVTKASITVTSNTGTKWSFEAKEDGNSTASSGYCNINNGNYGLTGCITFTPKDISISPDKFYTVNIVYNGDNKINYGVRFFTLETEVGYSVSFNANGGSGAPATVSKEKGVDAVIPETVPTRANYVFRGWALSPSAKTAIYQPGDKYGDDANVTLYAVWKAVYQSLDKVEIDRIGGDNRYKTAINISRTAFDSADVVVLANGFNYPDALAGVTLAKAADAPILLCDVNSITDDVLNEIKRLGAKKVYILGGKAAISENVEKKVLAYTSDIVRLAGTERSATAVEIAKELERITARVPDCVYLACDSNFPDALAISPVAAIEHNPILYMPKSGAASNATASYIKAIGCDRAVILGGEMAVSAEGKNSVESLGVSVERIQGDNRYETALAVCTRYDLTFNGDSIITATGRSFPDALAGGVLAAKTGCPILLIDENHVPDGARKYADSRKPDSIIVLGGTSAVSDNAVKQLTGTSSAGTGSSTSTSAKTTATTQPTSSTSATTSTTAANTDNPANWNGRTVYLTFNDGPSRNTPEILKILNDYKVKASFFVTYRSGQKSNYQAIVTGGHTIGIRNYEYTYSKIYSSKEAYFEDLEKLESYVKETTGVSPKYVRFPGGSSNNISKNYKEGIMTELTAALTEKGYKYYDWNVDCGDSVSNSVSKDVIVANVKKGVNANTRASKDSMIIFTDTVNKKSTVEALPEIIKWLQDEGYAIKPIDDSIDSTRFHQPLQNMGEYAA